MELLKIIHPVMGWQLINASDFDAEEHQLYEEPEPAEGLEKTSPVKLEETPPEKSVPQRKRKEA